MTLLKITLSESAAKLQAAEKIILTAHINPDGDAIGSTLAMLQILRSMGKDVELYIDDKIPKNFQILPFAEEIRRPREYEKLSADLLVVLDSEPARTGTVKDVVDAPILNIDHHVTNSGEGYDLYVDATAAATCEIILNLCHELKAEITKNVAVCLYTGIATDTGFFNYSNTKPATFRAAAELVESGVEPNIVSEQVEKRSYRDVKIMSAVLKTTKLFYGGKVAGMFIDRELYKEVETTEGLIDLIRVIDGVEVAFLITEKEKNVCRVSMRSKGVEVSNIARRLGGGGHVRAAGCTIEKNLDMAKMILVRNIGEYMAENGWMRPIEFSSRDEVSLADFEVPPEDTLDVPLYND
jgi:phosphoesterase RecJ-like protein